jgi:hypothetical protein
MIRGYQFAAADYCGECLPHVFAGSRAAIVALFRGMNTEDVLDHYAQRAGVNRDDEHSFDSDDFPKTVTSDHNDECDCCNCGTSF